VLVVCACCIVPISEAGTRTVLTRWSPTGGVTVLDDGEVTASFGIEPISPGGVAVTADGSTLYAAEFSSGSFAKIDLDGQQIVEIITTGDGAHRVVLNSDETLAYVANRDEQTVSIVYLPSFTEVLPVPAAPNPRSVIVGPDDEAFYVAHNGINEPDLVSKFTDVGQPVDSIELDQGWPSGMAISPDGSELLVALETSVNPGIARIDLATFTLTEIVPLPYRPTVILFHPSGSPMYVTSWFDFALLTLDPETLEVLDELEILVYPAGADITPDGKHLYIHRAAGSEALVVDTATNTVIGEIDVGGNSRGFGKFIVGAPPDDVPAVSGIGMLVLIAVMLGVLGLWTRRHRALP
jgi:DNA-binding beta-propeller fold protein YncE